MEAPTRRFAIELLEPLIARGHGDICADFSTHLPIRVFAEWMNLRDEDAAKLAVVGRAFNVAVQSNIDDLVKSTSLELYAIARDLFARRRPRRSIRRSIRRARCSRRATSGSRCPKIC